MGLSRRAEPPERPRRRGRRRRRSAGRRMAIDQERRRWQPRQQQAALKTSTLLLAGVIFDREQPGVEGSGQALGWIGRRCAAIDAAPVDGLQLVQSGVSISVDLHLGDGGPSSWHGRPASAKKVLLTVFARTVLKMAPPAATIEFGHPAPASGRASRLRVGRVRWTAQSTASNASRDRGDATCIPGHDHGDSNCWSTELRQVGRHRPARSRTFAAST